MTLCTRQRYVDLVIRNYVRLPGTPLRASRRDRQLAAALFDRGVRLQAVWAAFVIAATRWAIRSPNQRKLEPIKTLYYFLPALDEVLETNIDAGYLGYLAAKLQPFIKQKEASITAPAAGLDAQNPWSTNRDS